MIRPLSSSHQEYGHRTKRLRSVLVTQLLRDATHGHSFTVFELFGGSAAQVYSKGVTAIAGPAPGAATAVPPILSCIHHEPSSRLECPPLPANVTGGPGPPRECEHLFRAPNA